MAFDVSNVYLSTSYYVQQMFSTHRGTEILTVDNAQYDPLYYVASYNSQTKEVFIKIANPSPSTVNFSINISVQGCATAQASAIAISGSTYNMTNVPGRALSVLTYSPQVNVANGVVSLQVSPFFVGVITVS